MHALLAELGEPQRAFRAIHVVGTNGKSTATRRAAAFLAREGLERRRVHLAARDRLERADPGRRRGRRPRAGARARPRPAAERVGATQFEVLTAAALAEFAAAGVEVAVVEAGLGGRLDATNVLDAEVVALTNVALDHTDVLGETREAIAEEKLAVVAPGATVVLGEPEWASRARARGAGRVVVTDDVGRAAAEAFLGRALEGDVEARLPGRFDEVGDDVFAGAHNPAGVEWLLERLPRGDYVVVASILADKDAEAMLTALARAGDTLVATASRSARALPADELAARAEAVLRASRDRSPTRPRRSSAGTSWRASRAPCSSPARSICSPTSPSDFSAYHGEVRRAPERLRGCRRRRPDDRRPRVWRRVSGREAPPLRRRAWPQLQQTDSSTSSATARGP